MNNTATKQTPVEKKRNVTITALFNNDKFGEGSLLSAEITGEAYDNMIKNVQIGTKLLIKKMISPKTGKAVYFLEVLPQLAKTFDSI